MSLSKSKCAKYWKYRGVYYSAAFIQLFVVSSDENVRSHDYGWYIFGDQVYEDPCVVFIDCQVVTYKAYFFARFRGGLSFAELRKSLDLRKSEHVIFEIRNEKSVQVFVEIALGYKNIVPKRVVKINQIVLHAEQGETMMLDQSNARLVFKPDYHRKPLFKPWSTTWLISKRNFSEFKTEKSHNSSK